MDKSKKNLSAPIFSWDNNIKPQQITSDSKYRNIGEMLVVHSENAQKAMRLCGIGEETVSGAASDYEKFRALIETLPLMPGHRVTTVVCEIMKKVFGIPDFLSYGIGSSRCENIWRHCNNIIDEESITPLSLAELLGVETMFLRYLPFDVLPAFEKSSVNLYPVFDLGEICSEAVLCRLAAKSKDSRTFGDFVSILSEKLNEFLSKGCKAVRITLSDYHYERNSRKKEIDGILLKIQSGTSLTKNDLYQFSTALSIEAASLIRKKNLCLILQTKQSAPSELVKLYDYLKQNLIVPETLLISSRPESFSDFIDLFAFRTEKGLPGIIPAVQDPVKASLRFPLGFLLHNAEDMNDITDFGRFFETLSPDIIEIIHKNAIKRFLSDH